MNKTPRDRNESMNDVPNHLRRRPTLYVREEDRIVEAPAEDTAVARSYPRFPDKGPIVDRKRLTLLTRKTTYKVNEEIHVIHVVEVLEPGYQVYIMGPKTVYGEYVDGRLVTEPPPTVGDPLVPPTYNGVTLPSPAVDYNYEITSYIFSKPGTHQIYWKLDSLQSNTLSLEIK